MAVKFDDSMSFIEKAKHLLSYNRDSGIFRWTKQWYACRPGDIAGNINAGGYVVIGLFGKDEYAHRLAWMFEHGKPPEHQIDHIDTDKVNNEISNLRDAPPSVNSQNARRARSTSKSGILGVYFKYGKWHAALEVSGVKKTFGPFDSSDEAYAAYVSAKVAAHPGCTLVSHPKENVVRSAAYRRLVAALPCHLCRVEGYSQAAHADIGKGERIKSSDLTCYPLCGPHWVDGYVTAGCHNLVGATGTMTRDERREFEAEAAASTRLALLIEAQDDAKVRKILQDVGLLL